MRLLLLTLVHAATLDGVPSTGAEAANFVPAGWRIEQTVAADFDGVAPADQLVVLRGTAEVDAPRALVWLSGSAAGGYRLIDSNVGLLPCVACMGVKGGDGAPTIQVSKRIVSITTLGGSREVQQWVHRFRFENGTVRLIGVDVSVTDTLNGAGSNRSENLLTGTVVHETTPPRINDEGVLLRKKSTRKTTRGSVKPPVALHDVVREE